MKNNTVFTTAAICLTLTITTGCSKPAEPSQTKNITDTNTTATQSKAMSTNDQAKSDDADNKVGYDEYVMAVDASYRPFSFKDEHGRSVGFDIDLIRAIGDTQHFTVSVTGVVWEEAFEGLANNRYDMLGSGVTITPQRQEVVDFTDAYMDSYTAFATISPDINTIEDIKNRRIGVQSGAYYLEQVQNSYGETNEMVNYPTIFLSCKDMLTKKVNVCLDDIHILQDLFGQLSDYSDVSQVKYIKAFDDEEKQMAFAISKNNTEMREKINAGLKQIKADGTYEKIHSKWFGIESK